MSVKITGCEFIVEVSKPCLSPVPDAIAAVKESVGTRIEPIDHFISKEEDDKYYVRVVYENKEDENGTAESR